MQVVHQFSLAIQNTPYFTALRESALTYPIILSSHLATIAVFGGLILMTDLRLLGLALMGSDDAKPQRGRSQRLHPRKNQERKVPDKEHPPAPTNDPQHRNRDRQTATRFSG